MARLCLGFESALARETLRRGDGASCPWLIGPGSPVGLQDRGKLAARLANARTQRNAAGGKIFPSQEELCQGRAGAAEAACGSVSRPPPPAGSGSHRACGRRAPQRRSGPHKAWGKSWRQRGPAAPHRPGAEGGCVTGRGVPALTGWP